MDPIKIVDYDPRWPGEFAEIAGRVRVAFADVPLIAVEHVGSTSVMGLAAKPIIDLDVIVPSPSDVPDAIARLAILGYVHEGDKGVPGREAFLWPPGMRRHHLYLCLCDNVEYRRHVAFRDYLREHRDEAHRYEALKRDLVAQFRNDRPAYSEGKTQFVEAVLAKARGEGMDEVIVVEYDPCWPEQFAEEAGRLRQAMGDALVAVEHVGSTSVPGLPAKPVIDILVGVRALGEGEPALPVLDSLGYECRGENGIPGRLFFRKGPVQYRRTHHLHMVEPGHEQWESMLSFRDYLRAYPDEARRYEVLKHDLARQFRDDRRAYTEGKTEFVRAVLEKAKARG